MTHSKRNIVTEFLLLICVATLWGSSFTFIKIGVETIPPITFIALRTIIASAVLFFILKIRKISLPRDLKTWTQFTFQAVMNSAVPFTLVAWSEQFVDASLANILNSSSPIFAFLLTYILGRLKILPPYINTPRVLFGVITGMLGICIIVGFQSFNTFGQQFLAQIALVFAALCYAGAALFGRQFKHLDSMVPATGSLICGAIILSPISIIVDHPWTLHPSQSSMIALIFLSLFSTALAFVIYFRLFRTLGSVGATSQAFLRVPIGVMISAYALNETLSSHVWIGLICVVMGVAAMTIPAKSFPAKKA
jgi:drug/metabolite transporter (DMT)-like permease